ncbi:nucleoporin protein Ndc1-Nup [Powellomyces hirtus]|nr:nucleoporin protein Ndc1-Nup [Powellomyces hirtus]
MWGPQSNAYVQAVSPKISSAVVSRSWLVFLAVHALIICWSLSLRDLFGLGLLRKIIYPSTWLMSFASALPISALLYLRANHLQVQRRVARSRLSDAITFFDQTTVLFAAVYIVSSVILGMTYLGINDRRLETALFLYPEGRFNPPQLNENIVFIFGFCIYLGAAYPIHRRYAEKDQLQFPRIHRVFWWRIKLQVPVSFQTAMILGTKLMLSYVVLYVLFGSTIYDITAGITELLVGRLVKHPKYRLSVLNIGRLIHTYFTGLLTLSCWELVNQWFEVLLTEFHDQEIAISTNVLASGLSLPSREYAKYLAFRRLTSLVSYDRAQRVKFYTEDVDAGRSAWRVVSQSCLSQIDQLSDVLEKEQVAGQARRSKFKNIPKKVVLRPVSQPALKAARKQTVFTHIAIKARHLLYPPGSPSRYVDGVEEPPEPAPSTVNAQGWHNDPKRDEIPVLLRKRPQPGTEPEHPPIVTLTVKPPQPEKKIYGSKGEQTLEAIREWVDQWTWGRWLVGESLARQTQWIFKDIQVQIWAIEAITCLVTSAALHADEDKFGQVSQDLTTVIQSLLRCQMAIEQRIRTPPISPDMDPSMVKVLAASQVVSREAWAALQVLQNAMYRIVRAWYIPLAHVRLNPEYAHVFQRYLDFRE